MTPSRLRELMRPSFNFATEWQAKTGDVGLFTIDGTVRAPTYPIFGPPPPFFDVGFGYTNIDSPAAFDLPTDLYDISFGLSWMRRLNDRWLMRFMLGAAFATDGNNTSSDAWQFRGGVFGIYRRSPKISWLFGAIALGRNDLPVLPAVGLIYQPNDRLRFDVLMPKPRIAFRLVDNGARQQWGYFGAGLNGKTWAFENDQGVDDQLTYADWRFVLGWESIPTPEPGMPFTRGRKFAVEAGYVFSRDFEFESARPTIGLDDTLMLRVTASF
jgi:hypothetical protein